MVNPELQMVFNLSEPAARGRVQIVLAGLCGAAIAGLSTGLFFTGFLLEAGLDVTDISLLGGIPLLMSLCTLFTPMLLCSFPRRKKILSISRLVSHFFSLVVLTMLPLLPAPKPVLFGLMAAAYVISNGANQLFVSGYSAWHFSFLPGKVRAVYITTQQLVNAAVSAVTLLVTGVLSDMIGRSGDPAMFFRCIRLLAFGLAVLEVYIFSRPPEPVYREEDHARHPLYIFSYAKKHIKFMGTLVIVFLWNLAAFIGATPYEVYLLQDVGVPYYLISGLTASLFLYLAVFSTGWNRLIRKWNWLRTFAVAVMLYAPFSAALGFVTKANYRWMYPGVRGLQLVLFVGLSITVNNMAYINIPKTGQTAGFSLNIVVSNLGAFAGQMLSTALVRAGQNLRFELFGAAFGIVTVLLCMQGALQALSGLYALLRERALMPEEDDEDTPVAEAEAPPG